MLLSLPLELLRTYYTVLLVCVCCLLVPKVMQVCSRWKNTRVTLQCLSVLVAGCFFCMRSIHLLLYRVLGKIACEVVHSPSLLLACKLCSYVGYVANLCHAVRLAEMLLQHYSRIASHSSNTNSVDIHFIQCQASRLERRLQGFHYSFKTRHRTYSLVGSLALLIVYHRSQAAIVLATPLLLHSIWWMN